MVEEQSGGKSLVCRQQDKAWIIRMYHPLPSPVGKRKKCAWVHVCVSLSVHLDGIHLLSEFLDLVHQALVLLLGRLLHSTALSELNREERAEKWYQYYTTAK